MQQMNSILQRAEQVLDQQYNDTVYRAKQIKNRQQRKKFLQRKQIENSVLEQALDDLITKTIYWEQAPITDNSQELSVLPVEPKGLDDLSIRGIEFLKGRETARVESIRRARLKYNY